MSIQIRILHITAAAFGVAALGCNVNAAPAKPKKPAPQVTVSVAAPGASLSLADAMAKLPTYELGQSRLCLTAIEAGVRDAAGDPQQRTQLAAKLATLLDGDATVDAKDFACRQLYLIGGEESIASLAKLLKDPKLSDAARYALQMNVSPAAGAALRQALGEVKGRPLAGVVESLGQRRDTEAVPAIAKLAGSDDAEVAGSALCALGRIANAEAAAAIKEKLASAPEKLKAEAEDAAINCAERLIAAGDKQTAAGLCQAIDEKAPSQVRLGALRSLVKSGSAQSTELVCAALSDEKMQRAAAGLVADAPGGEAATKAFVELLPKLKPDMQALVIAALGARGDRAATPAVMAAAKGEEAVVRVAALRALATLGDAASVPVLAKSASASGAEQEAARDALDRLPQKDVNAALVAAMEQGDARQKAELVRSLGARGAKECMDAIVSAAGSPDAAVQSEAFKALANLSDASNIPALLKLLAADRPEAARRMAEKAVASACDKVQPGENRAAAIVKELTSAQGAYKCSLLRVLPLLGDDKTLDIVRQNLAASDAELKDAAVRSLADWPTLAAADDMVKIAADANAALPHRVLALRGYVRLAGKRELSADQRLAMYKGAMAAAQRPEDQRLVLGGLSEVKQVAALDMVLPLLDQAAVAQEAAQAAVTIARDLPPTTEAVAPAMKKVIAATKDQKIRKAAEEVLAAQKKK